MVFLTSLFVGIIIYYWPNYGLFISFFIAMSMEIFNNIFLAKTVQHSENRLHDMYSKRLENYREREEKYLQTIEEYKQMFNNEPDDNQEPV